MDRDSEQVAVDRLRNGDTAAFDAVYEEFRSPLFSFLCRLARRRDVAEDLLEETWLRLVAHARRLRPDTRLAPWLFTVARNVYWSYCRARLPREARSVELVDLWPVRDDRPSPFDLAAASELETRFERALARVSARHREVLLLVAVEGLTPREAADVCGVSPVVFRQRLSRARTALASQLESRRQDPTARLSGAPT